MKGGERLKVESLLGPKISRRVKIEIRRQNPLAAKSRVDPTKLGEASKHQDGIGHIDASIVVGVGSVLAVGRRLAQEKRTEHGNGVGDVEPAIIVGVPAKEASVVRCLDAEKGLLAAAEDEGFLVISGFKRRQIAWIGRLAAPAEDFQYGA